MQICYTWFVVRLHGFRHHLWRLDHRKLLLFLTLRYRSSKCIRFGGLDNTMFGVHVARSFAAQRLDAQRVERPD